MHTPTSLPLTLLLLLTLLAPCHGHAQAQAQVQTLTPGANEHDSNPGPNHVFQRFRPGLGSGPKAQIPLHVPSAVDLDSDLSWDTDGAEEDDDGKGGGGGGADVDVHEMLQGGVVRCGWEVMEMAVPMARLGALYAAQTGDRSQCVDIDIAIDSTATSNTSTSTSTNTTTSHHVHATTKNATSTFCACVFETCGNGVWARRASPGDDEDAWDYVKACERYCHVGTCV